MQALHERAHQLAIALLQAVCASTVDRLAGQPGEEPVQLTVRVDHEQVQAVAASSGGGQPEEVLGVDRLVGDGEPVRERGQASAQLLGGALADARSAASIVSTSASASR